MSTLPFLCDCAEHSPGPESNLPPSEQLQVTAVGLRGSLEAQQIAFVLCSHNKRTRLKHGEGAAYAY